MAKEVTVRCGNMKIVDDVDKSIRLVQTVEGLCIEECISHEEMVMPSQFTKSLS